MCVYVYIYICMSPVNSACSIGNTHTHTHAHAQTIHINSHLSDAISQLEPLPNEFSDRIPAAPGYIETRLDGSAPTYIDPRFPGPTLLCVLRPCVH